MRILMLSTDPRILEEGSEARERMRMYGTCFDALHVVVCARVVPEQNGGTIAANVFVYPTNSSSRLHALRDAYRIGAQLLAAGGDWTVTSQDPFETGLVACALKNRFPRVYLVLQLHTDCISPAFRRESLKNRLRALLARSLLPRADRIRVVSQRIADSLKSQISNFSAKGGSASGGKPQIAVLPIFVDTDAIGRAPEAADLEKKYPGRSIILMLSRLTLEKNIALAVRAMRRIAANRPEALLLIAGDGPERQSLEKLVHALNLEEYVQFCGWISEPADVYRAADVFLLTSNYEGYGRTAVEAMAAGLPVVTTDVGLAGEVIHDGVNGCVVPVGDEAALAEAVRTLLEDPALREWLGKEAQKTIRAFPGKEAYLAAFKKALEP